MSGIWDVGKPQVTVEKRKITPRKREPRKPFLRDQTFRKPAGPIASEVSRALQDSPIRFPAHWIKGD